MRKYHFISGLPRSGSTLLSAILKQNPRFTTNISDPLHGYIKGIIQVTNTAAGMDAMVSMNKRREIMRGLFDSYYSSSSGVCFNTNRGWSSDTPLLRELYPDFRMIVCLRDIPWVLDSFERLNASNPQTIKPLYHHQDLSNVYERTHMLMGNIQNYAGYVAGPLANVRHSMSCSERDQILYVEYEHLVKNTAEVVAQIYDFIGEPHYNHDFNNVEDSYDEFDQQAKIDGLHKVRRRIEWIPRRTVLPDDLWNQYEGSTFWKHNFGNTKRELNWSLQGIQLQRSRVIEQPVVRQVPKLNRQL